RVGVAGGDAHGELGVAGDQREEGAAGEAQLVEAALLPGRDLDLLDLVLRRPRVADVPRGGGVGDGRQGRVLRPEHGVVVAPGGGAQRGVEDRNGPADVVGGLGVVEVRQAHVRPGGVLPREVDAEVVGGAREPVGVGVLPRLAGEGDPRDRRHVRQVHPGARRGHDGVGDAVLPRGGHQGQGRGRGRDRVGRQGRGGRRGRGGRPGNGGHARGDGRRRPAGVAGRGRARGVGRRGGSGGGGGPRAAARRCWRRRGR